MTTSEKLQQELQNVLSGNPWYGTSVYGIIEQVSFEAAYERPPGHVHAIAEIVLHMLSWTEEAIDRMNGKPPGNPLSGDWPETGTPDEQKWQEYVNDLKLVNVNLLKAIRDFPEEKWAEDMSDAEDHDFGIARDYEDMVRGLIQHHIYHAGQIAILLKILL